MTKITKDLQLCGMGNGLVDIQYALSDEKISSFGMQKGEMRLIDKAERDRLIDFFKNDKYTQCSGGSAANSIIAFTQLGGTASYKTVLGNDELGKFYAKEFEELGIILRAEFRKDYPTGSCFVFISPDSERTMLTSLEATAFFGTKNLDEELIARSEWVYIEGYKFSQEGSTDAVYKTIELAKKHNTKIAFTISDIFIIDNFYDKVMGILPDCDLIFCNEGEAAALTRTSSTEEASKKLFKITKNAIITKGPAGSLIKWEGNIYEVPAFPTTALDTTGAGDMYAGAFLYGICTKQNPVYAGRLASLCSSKVVSQFGARMNEDFQNLKHQIDVEFVK